MTDGPFSLFFSKFSNHHHHTGLIIKGGIARASTMTLSHYMRNEKKRAVDVLTAMKAKRPIVMLGVLHYPAIVQLERERMKKK